MIFLTDAGGDRKIKLGPADLLSEEIPCSPLISLKIFGLDLRPNHLNEFIELPSLLQTVELLPAELDTHLDTSLPASLFDVEDTNEHLRAAGNIIRSKEKRDAEVLRHAGQGNGDTGGSQITRTGKIYVRRKSRNANPDSRVGVP